jgi:signal transduction histidine kinase
MIDRIEFGTRRYVLALGAVLVIALLLVGALAWKTWETSRAHRASVERALTDYAQFGAWTFANRVRSLTFAATAPTLSAAGGSPATASAVLARLRKAADSTTSCRCRPDLAPTFFFLFDRRDGKFAGASSTDQPDGVSRAQSDRLALAMGSWKGDTTTANPEYHVLLLTGTDSAVVFERVNRDAADPGVLLGFQTSLGRIGAVIFARGFLDTPLLPRSLLGGQPNDSLFSLSVVDRQRRPIYQTATRYSGTYTGAIGIPGSGGELEAQLTLNPRTVSGLIIGGVPQAPITLLAFLLSMTLLALGVAFAFTWRAGELARLRSDFTSSISHELRTPLTQISMYAELMHTGRSSSPDDRRAATSIILRETGRLRHLIDNVLQFARIERRLLGAAPTYGELPPALREIIREFEPIAAAESMQIGLVTPTSLRANFDSLALRHVLFNLLDNAVRYGRQGQRIMVSAKAHGPSVRIAVDDQGDGIPVEAREEVWKPFSRLQRRTTDAPGSGIGLSVVRQLVAAMGGSVSIESAPQGGARLIINLQQAPSAAIDPDSAPQPDEMSTHTL